MPLELVFEIEGDTQLIRRLQGVEIGMKNFSPEFKKTGDLLLKTFRENFKSEGRDIGEPWKPLKPETLIQKQRLGFAPDILVRTGALKGGFKARPSQFEVVVSNLVDYFSYHQSNRPRNKLPRRIMMKIDEKRKQMIVKIFQGSVQEKLQQRGFKP